MSSQQTPVSDRYVMFAPTDGLSYMVKDKHIDDMLAIKPCIDNTTTTSDNSNNNCTVISVPQWLSSQLLTNVVWFDVYCSLEQLVQNIKTANFLGHEKYLREAYYTLADRLLLPKQLLALRRKHFGHESSDPDCNLLYKIWWYMNYDPLNMEVDVEDMNTQVNGNKSVYSVLSTLEYTNIVEMLNCAKFPTVSPQLWLCNHRFDFDCSNIVNPQYTPRYKVTATGNFYMHNLCIDTISPDDESVGSWYPAQNPLQRYEYLCDMMKLCLEYYNPKFRGFVVICHEQLKTCWVLAMQHDMFDPNLYMLRFPKFPVTYYSGVAFQMALHPINAYNEQYEDWLWSSTNECKQMLATLGLNTQAPKSISTMTKLKNYALLNLKSDSELKTLCHEYRVIYDDNNHPFVRSIAIPVLSNLITS